MPDKSNQFESSYIVEAGAEVHWPPERLFYISEDNKSPFDGTAITIWRSDGTDATLVFRLDGCTSYSAVLTCPHPDWICVIDSGAAAIVDVNDPNQWTPILLHGVSGSLNCKLADVLFLSGFSEIVAIDRNGVRWTSPQLAWDEVSLIRCDGAVLEAEGFSAPDRKNLLIHIKVESGKVLKSAYSWE